MKRIARNLILRLLPNQFRLIQLIYQKFKFLTMVARLKLSSHILLPRLAIWPIDKHEGDASQFGQSSVVEILLESLEGGVFVDIGANNPKYNSNSYYLEVIKNWSGYAFEPLDFYKERYAETRPSTVFHCCAIGTDFEDKWLQVGQGQEGWEDQLSTVRDDDSYSNSLNIKVMPLSHFNLPNKVDFLSIDVEGSETKVLGGINWNEFNAQIICIENCKDTLGDATVREKLVQLGFVFLARISYIDDLFVSPELWSRIDQKSLTKSLKPFFSVYNVTD